VLEIAFDDELVAGGGEPSKADSNI